MGLCGAIDTLVSQAYGKKNYKLCGTYLNTSRILFTLLFIPQAIILLNSNSLLKFFNQPKESAEIAQKYVHATLFGAFLNMQFEANRRFMVSQGEFPPVLCTMIGTTLFHICGLYIFVLHLGWGISGVGIITAVTFTLNFIATSVYINSKKKQVISDKWFFLDQEGFQRIPEFLKYGIPAALMLIFEIPYFWLTVLGYDMMTLFSGWIGTEEQAANIIMFQIWIFICMNTVGITYSSTGFIGNSLGGNRPRSAKAYAYSTLLFGLLITACILFVYYLIRRTAIGQFSSDRSVTDLVFCSFPCYILAIFSDAGQGLGGGILRTIGYQHFASIIQFISMWIIYFPLAYIFAFELGYGFKGLWFAAPIGPGLTNIGFILLVLFSNWESIAKNASAATNQSSQSNPELPLEGLPLKEIAVKEVI